MKNNKFIKIFSTLILASLLSMNLCAEEIKIDSSELNILDGGNILQGKNGFKSYSGTGLEITGDEFKYDKNKNTLEARGNIILIDKIKNMVIEGNNIKYFKNND